MSSEGGGDRGDVRGCSTWSPPAPTGRCEMDPLFTTLIVVAAVVVIGLVLAIRIVQQYEMGVQFRLGRVVGVRQPGLRLIVPIIDAMRKVSLRIVTMPIQSQEIITRDN